MWFEFTMWFYIFLMSVFKLTSLITLTLTINTQWNSIVYSSISLSLKEEKNSSISSVNFQVESWSWEEFSFVSWLFFRYLDTTFKSKVQLNNCSFPPGEFVVQPHEVFFDKIRGNLIKVTIEFQNHFN